MLPARPKRCTECGKPWPDPDAPWPRTCTVCARTTWRYARPTVVAILLAKHPTTEVEHVLLGSRAPHVGLTLFSGFMEHQTDDFFYDWRAEAARMVREETSGLVQLAVEDFVPLKEFPFTSTPGGIVQVYAVARIPWVNADAFMPNHAIYSLYLLPLVDVLAPNGPSFMFHHHREALLKLR